MASLAIKDLFNESNTRPFGGVDVLTEYKGIRAVSRDLVIGEDVLQIYIFDAPDTQWHWKVPVGGLFEALRRERDIPNLDKLFKEFNRSVFRNECMALIGKDKRLDTSADKRFRQETAINVINAMVFACRALGYNLARVTLLDILKQTHECKRDWEKYDEEPNVYFKQCRVYKEGAFSVFKPSYNILYHHQQTPYRHPSPSTPTEVYLVDNGAKISLFDPHYTETHLMEYEGKELCICLYKCSDGLKRVSYQSLLKATETSGITVSYRPLRLFLTTRECLEIASALLKTENFPLPKHFILCKTDIAFHPDYTIALLDWLTLKKTCVDRLEQLWRPWVR